jgi:nucleoside-diphosphate-sugar epimerase
VLVTGATGGLGRVLVPALVREGLQVVATGRRREPPAELCEPHVTYTPADLECEPLEPIARGVETVFHLAARSSPWGTREAFTRANVVATQRVLDAARAAGCRRFIHVSTPSIYTEARDRLGLTEVSPLPQQLANEYARSKLQAERLVIEAASRGMPTVVLRPRAIVGPFDTVLLPRLLRAARRGTLVLPDGGRALVELTDARDVVSALLAARDRAQAVSGRVFNISGGAPLPLAHVAAMAFAAMGRPVRIRSIDARLALLLSAGVERVAALWPGRPEPPLTRYSTMVAGWSQTFDLRAARTLLQWTPRYSPQEAVTWALSGLQHA